MREEYGLPSPQKKRQRPVFLRSVGFQPAPMLPKAAARMAALPVNKRQRVREPQFFLRSAGFQPATMLPKAAAKMAALPVNKRQRVREPQFFLRSAGFQPAPMLPKAAAKMAALPVNKKQAVVNMRKDGRVPRGMVGGPGHLRGDFKLRYYQLWLLLREGTS